MITIIFTITFGQNIVVYLYQSVKRFGSTAGLNWVQTVCKGNQQMTKVTPSMEKEL